MSPRNPSLFGLILCNVLGIHNRQRRSLTGAVHYCGRCGIVTRDSRRHKLHVADAKKFAPGKKIIYGLGQEYISGVVSVDCETNTVTISQGVALPKWRSWISKAVMAIKRSIRRWI